MVYLFIIVVEIIVLLVLSRKVHRQVGALFYKWTRNRNATVWLSSLLFLPGTFVHEMSHFLTALFLLVPVGNVELIPKIVEEGNGEIQVTLGSVSIAKTDFLRRFIIGTAPLLFGFALVVFLIYFSFTNSTSPDSIFSKTYLDEVFTAYFVFTITNNMFSSKRDMEGSWVVLVFVLFVFLILWVFGVNLQIDWVNIGNSLNIEFLKSISIFMTIPVFFDILAVSLLKKI